MGPGSPSLRLHSLDGWRGVKPGISYGQTDDLGINVAEDPVHVHDFKQRCFIYWGLTTNALLSGSKADVSVSPTYMEKSSRNC